MSLVITSVSIRFQCSVTSDFSPLGSYTMLIQSLSAIKDIWEILFLLFIMVYWIFLSAFNSPWKHCKFTKSSVSLIPKVPIQPPWLKSVLASGPFEHNLSPIPTPPPPLPSNAYSSPLGDSSHSVSNTALYMYWPWLYRSQMQIRPKIVLHFNHRNGPAFKT